MSSILSVLPDPATLVAYTVACLILFITPGPDMSLFLAKTLSGGRQAGLAAMSGAMVGTCLHTVLAALGLSALLAASPAAFAALKVVGALYLLWLAVDAIRNGSALSLKAGGRANEPLWRAFGLGVLSNLTNPKVVLFFVTFLPQFVRAGDPDAAGKLLFLGFFFVVMSIPLAALMVLGAERLIGFVRSRPAVTRAIDWVFAAIFGAFAARIAWEAGRRA